MAGVVALSISFVTLIMVVGVMAQVMRLEKRTARRGPAGPPGPMGIAGQDGKPAMPDEIYMDGEIMYGVIRDSNGEATAIPLKYIRGI